MRVVLTIALKDLKLLRRDKMAIFFAFLFPLIYATFFGTIFSAGGGGGNTAMTILVVDQDQTDRSRSFIEALREAPELEVVPSSEEEAREEVRRGSEVAYILLPTGFGEASANRFTGQTPRVLIAADPKRKAEEGMLQGILTKYAAQDLQRLFQDPQAMEQQIETARSQLSLPGSDPLRQSLDRLFDEVLTLNALPNVPGNEGGFEMTPLEFESVPVIVEAEGPRNAYSISFPQGIIWGIMGCAASFGISLVIERQRGTLVRIQTGPVSRYQILGGKALACFLTTSGLAAVLLVLGAVVFSVQAPSLVYLFLAVASTATAFVGVMMLLSVVGKTEQAAAGIGWAVLLPMAMIGGAMVPLFLMPSWLQQLSHISPVKWAILAMEGAIWRGFTLSEMMFPCLILVGIGVACFAVGVRAFRWHVDA